MAARSGSARKLVSKPRACKAMLAPNGCRTAKRRPRRGGVHRRRTGEDGRYRGRVVSDRDLEGLCDLFLDRLDRFGHRLLRQGAEVLELYGHRVDLLAGEFGLQRDQVGERLGGERSLYEIEVGFGVRSQSLESLRVQRDRAILRSGEAQFESIGGIVHGSLRFGEGGARVGDAFFERRTDALLDLSGRLNNRRHRLFDIRDDRGKIGFRSRSKRRLPATFFFGEMAISFFLKLEWFRGRMKETAQFDPGVTLF